MSKEIVLKAHGGDVTVFDLLQSDADGNSTLGDWHSFLQIGHQEMGAAGDAWRDAVLKRLELQLSELTLRESEVVGEDAQWHALTDEADLVFKMVSGDDNIMDREELDRAYGGEFALFGELDGNADGKVSLSEWRDYLRKRHSEQGPAGDKSLKTLIKTLASNLANQWEVEAGTTPEGNVHREEEVDKKTGETVTKRLVAANELGAELIEEASRVFSLVAEQTANVSLMSVATLASSYPRADFTGMDTNNDGVSIEEWHLWLKKAHAAKG